MVPSGVRTGMRSTWGMASWWSTDLKMRSSLRLVGMLAISSGFEGYRCYAGGRYLADLDRTYAPRLAEFVSDERFGAWRCKLYGLADPAKGVRAELLDATRERAARQPPGGRVRRLRSPSRTTPRTRSRSCTGGRG